MTREDLIWKYFVDLSHALEAIEFHASERQDTSMLALYERAQHALNCLTNMGMFG